MRIGTKVKYMRRLWIVITMAIVGFALMHAFTIGYGSGYKAINRTEMAMRKAMEQYEPSCLKITYERNRNGEEDILRLKIDTTYREIGKKSFVYEMICDRYISLTDDNGVKFSHEQALNCFAEGSSRQWIATNEHKRSNGYECEGIVTQTLETGFMAWQCRALPHYNHSAIITDGLQGVILEVYNTDGDYSLRAIEINEIIG